MSYHIALDLESNALWGDEGQIICYAFVGQDGLTKSGAAPSEDEEKDLLRHLLSDLWELKTRYHAPRILTYNGYHYHYPMIITRMLRWGMREEIRRFVSNFTGKAHLDLYSVVSRSLSLKTRDLHSVCAHFHLPLTSEPAGEWIDQQWAAGNYEGLRAHCCQEAAVLHPLYRRLADLGLIY